MDKFIKEENIRHYRRMLECATDEAERQHIARLMADDEGARDVLDAPHRTDGQV